MNSALQRQLSVGGHTCQEGRIHVPWPAMAVQCAACAQAGGAAAAAACSAWQQLGGLSSALTGLCLHRNSLG